MKKFIVYGLVALLITACGQQESPEEESTEDIKTVINMDSIRRVYTELIQLRLEALPSAQIAEKGKLNPVDEAPKDTLFFVFRENLRQLVKDKNVFGLLEAVDEQIKNGFGDNNGFAEFVTMWDLDKPEKAAESKIWAILEGILSLGGTFQEAGQQFGANYIASSWPAAYEPFEYGAIAGSGVRFRSAPTLQSTTIASISYDIVKVLSYTDKTETIGGETYPWVKVTLLDGREGYVYGKFLRSPVGYRAGFQRNARGEWQMSYLLTGD